MVSNISVLFSASGIAIVSIYIFFVVTPWSLDILISFSLPSWLFNLRILL